MSNPGIVLPTINTAAAVAETTTKTTTTTTAMTTSTLRNSMFGSNGTYRDMKKIMTYIQQQAPNDDPESIMKQIMNGSTHPTPTTTTTTTTNDRPDQMMDELQLQQQLQSNQYTQLLQTIQHQEQIILSIQESSTRLQAQNILGAVQQLDLMTRVWATISYGVVWYYLYWKCIVVTVLGQYVLPFLHQQLRQSQLPLQLQQSYMMMDPATSSSSSNHWWWLWHHSHTLYDAIVTKEGTTATLFFLCVEVPWYLLQCGVKSILQWLWDPKILPIVSFLIFGIAVPYYHHRNTFGLFYRRCDVFAVFFVFLIRMKLCRWRESIFVPTANDGTTTTKPPVTLIQNEKIQVNDNNDNDDDTDPAASNETISSYGTNIGEDDIWEANYEISARYLYVSILRLQGLWTKSAQYMSSRADFVPTPYVRELQRLQDAAPPTSFDRIQRMIPHHILNALTDIDAVPMASASIGQVHAAKLRSTGEKVVVKVQHPQARTLLMDDFRSLQIFCRIVQYVEPDYGFIGVLMREWSIEAKKELDFIQEMNNLKDAATSIESMMTMMMSNHSIDDHCLYTNATDTVASVPFQIEIPRPYDTLCTPDVLVMSYCEGKRIDDMEQMKVWNLNPTSVMDGVTQAFAHMMYVTSPFNGDPHAGNLLVRPGCTVVSNHPKENGTTTTTVNNDGFTIVLLDWGLAKRLTDNKRKAFCQMVYAAATFDYGLLLDAFTTIGLKLKRENVNEDMEGVRFLLREIAPRAISRKRIKAKIRTDTNRMNAREKKDKVPMESKAYPGEFFFFVRVNELLHGLGSKFGIHLNYVDILKPYAERGLSMLPPYSEHGGGAIVPVPPTLHDNNKTFDTKLQTKVTDVLHQLQQEGHIAGAQVCILNPDGAPLANVVVGHCGGLKKGIAMQSDTLVLGFSCTKAVAATLAHRMVQLGYLTYDECVCDSVWPAFCPTVIPPPGLYGALNLSVAEINERWMWKRHITLRHILTHTAGMWWALPAQLTIQRLASCEQCVQAFEYDSFAPENTLLPDSCPGSKTEYHFISFGWLVAGTLMGAYCRKHNLNIAAVTFEQVYNAILLPLLSPATLTSGFRPCGCSNGVDGIPENFPTAFVETQDISISKILQLQREAEAYGEADEVSSSAMNGNSNETTSTTLSMQNPQNLVKGKEFLLDQRIWNCEIGLRANCPAAGGRFSACGLAHFYHDLGTNRAILNDATLSIVTAPVIEATTAKTPTDTNASISFAFQGPTDMSKTTNAGNAGAATPTTASDEANRRALGFGYQLISFDSDPIDQPSAFGHAGVGGSIGMYHKSSKVSIGIMLNKIDADKSTTPRILRTIQQHFQW